MADGVRDRLVFYRELKVGEAESRPSHLRQDLRNTRSGAGTMKTTHI